MRKTTDTDIIYGKVPPQAIDLEKAILGAIMMDSSCLPTVTNMLFEDAFYRNEHQLIFKAIMNLYDAMQNIDVLTVVEKLRKSEVLEIVGGHYYVTTLIREVVSTANVEAHCSIVLQKFLGRKLIEISLDSLNNAYEDSTDIFELYDAADNKLLNTQERVLSGSLQDMNYYSKNVYEQYETVKTTGVLGIQTGIQPFDKTFSGLVSPDLFIIAARPGAGKTSLALSITHSTSIQRNIPCAWFSLEMDGVQLTRRLASIDSGISHEVIRQGRIDSSLEIKFFNSLDKIKKSPIFIEDKTNMNVRSIRTRANILKRKYDIQYIVVDYLQLMDGIEIKNKNRETIISEISRGLKGLAKELKIPVIALSQLSREVEKRTDKMPQLSDLRESGAIEQDADCVLFLMRPEYYGFAEAVEINGKEYAPAGLCIGKGAKNRHGSTQNFAMQFTGSTMHFATHPQDEGFVPKRFNDIDEDAPF